VAGGVALVSEATAISARLVTVANKAALIMAVRWFI